MPRRHGAEGVRGATSGCRDIGRGIRRSREEGCGGTSRAKRAGGLGTCTAPVPAVTLPGRFLKEPQPHAAPRTRGGRPQPPPHAELPAAARAAPRWGSRISAPSPLFALGAGRLAAPRDSRRGAPVPVKYWPGSREKRSCPQCPSAPRGHVGVRGEVASEQHGAVRRSELLFGGGDTKGTHPQALGDIACEGARNNVGRSLSVTLWVCGWEMAFKGPGRWPHVHEPVPGSGRRRDLAGSDPPPAPSGVTGLGARRVPRAKRGSAVPPRVSLLRDDTVAGSGDSRAAVPYKQPRSCSPRLCIHPVIPSPPSPPPPTFSALPVCLSSSAVC